MKRAKRRVAYIKKERMAWQAEVCAYRDIHPHFIEPEIIYAFYSRFAEHGAMISSRYSLAAYWDNELIRYIAKGMGTRRTTVFVGRRRRAN